MHGPKYISQRTLLQKRIRMERRIRLEQTPSMDVVFVAARSTAEDIHSYSEGLRRSPDEYEITPQSQHIENNILIKKKPEPQPAPIQDMPINSPIRRIRRSYDNLSLLPELPENSGRYESSGEFLRHSTDDDEGIGRTMKASTLYVCFFLPKMAKKKKNPYHLDFLGYSDNRFSMAYKASLYMFNCFMACLL